MVDEALVNEIVRRVLGALSSPAAPSASAGPAAPATPGPATAPTSPTMPAPATGLSPSPAVPPPSTPRKPAPSPMPMPNPVPAPSGPRRKVFVTADDFARRAGGTKTVRLMGDEVLTPNAEDYAEIHRIRIERIADPVAAAPAEQAVDVIAAAHGSGLVVSGPEQKVASALTALGRDGFAMTRFDQTDCWMRNSSALLKAIRAGPIGSGVILAPTSPAAVVFANKYRGIRAVTACDTDTVREAVEALDANVLVIDHGKRSFFEIRTLIKTFLAARALPRTRSAILDTFDKLEGKA